MVVTPICRVSEVTRSASCLPLGSLLFVAVLASMLGDCRPSFAEVDVNRFVALGIEAYQQDDFEQARDIFLKVLEGVDERLPQYREKAYQFLAAACWRSSDKMRRQEVRPALQFVRRAEAWAAIQGVIKNSSGGESEFTRAALKHLRELSPIHGPELNGAARAGGWEDPTGVIHPIIATPDWLDSGGRVFRFASSHQILSLGEKGEQGLSQQELYQAAYRVFEGYANQGGPVWLMKLRSEPAGAEVLVDGELQPGLVTPCDLALLVEPGKPEPVIAVQKEKYVSSQGQKVALQIGEPRDVVFRLELQPARLRITGNPPPGAQVTVDGKDYPIGQEIKIAVGHETAKTYALLIKADGYRTQEVNVDLEPGQTSEPVQVDLAALPAMLRVTAEPSPPKAEVVVNGQKYPLNPDDPILVDMEQQAELIVEVEVRADGYVQTELPRVTLARGRETPVKVALTKQPGWKLSFEPGADSYFKVDGQRAGDVVGQAIPWNERLKTGDKIVIVTKDGDIEYFEGHLEGEDEQRRVDGPPGFLKGKFKLDGEQLLTDARLQPVAVPKGEFAAVSPERWSDLWVGTYQLTGEVQLPGLESIPVERDVKVTRQGAELRLKDLLPGDLKAKLRTHNVTLTVQCERVVDGEAKPQGARQVDAVATPVELDVDRAVDKLGEIGVRAGDLAAKTPSKTTGTGEVVFLGLCEGEYTVQVNDAAPQLMTVTRDGASPPPVTLREYFATLPFQLPDGWTVDHNGGPKKIDGKLMPIAESDEGAVAVGDGKVKVWEGKLKDGRISPENTDGFVRDSLKLDGVMGGMSGKLVPDQVPAVLAGRVVNPVDGETKANAVTWDVPIGTYRLEVEGFEPMTVTVPSEPLSAKMLKAKQIDFRLSFAPPIDPAEISSCTIEPKENGVPYLALHPDEKPHKDLKAAGWHQTLPAGTYELRALWNGDRPMQCTQSVEVGVDNQARTLTTAQFAEVLVSVEVTGSLYYDGFVLDGGGNDVPGEVPLSIGKTTSTLTLIGPGIRQTIDGTKSDDVGDETIRLRGSVPPGQYQMELSVKTLNRQNKEGPEVVCATAPGALTVEVPPPGRTKLIVVISCDVSAGKEPRRVLKIESLNWQ